MVKKARLSGLWLPDDRKILIDKEVPELKHRWIEAHEISHSFIPWHSEFLLGDTEITLALDCHEMIEAEANFGAGRMLFFGDKFTRVRDDGAIKHAGRLCWVLNKSLLAAGTDDPLLAARLAGERRQMERLSTRLARRMFIVPWLIRPPIGFGELSRLVSQESNEPAACP